MTTDTFLALLALAFINAWTPGPNNAMVAASGATFGLRRTMPHIAGIAIGFPVMVFAVGLLLAQAFQTVPILKEILRWGGAALLLWVAWRVASSGGAGSAGAARPFTFLQAAGFQWINPKGWALAIAVTAQFLALDASPATALTVAAVFVAAGFTSALGWAGFGWSITRWVDTPARLRAFNMTMGLLIASCVVFLFLD